MKMKTEEEKVNDICKSIRDNVRRWREINQDRCNDPFGQQKIFDMLEVRP